MTIYTSITRLTAILITFIILFSCKQSPEFNYNKNGISFICPKGWKITDEDQMDVESFYLSVEKNGFDASGLWTVTTLDYEADLYDWIEIYEEEYRMEPAYKNSNLQFSTPREGQYGQYETLKVTYTATIMGFNHHGEIHVFNDDMKSVAIIFQEASDDVKVNKAGFDRLEKSFVVN